MQQIQQQMILMGRSLESRKEEGALINNIEERRIQEDILWKQKSIIQWLREGEKSSSFFHKAMIQRCQHNKIFSLKDLEGNCLVEHQDLEKELVNHFKEILTDPNPDRSAAIDQIKQYILAVFNRDQNLALLREITMT